MTFIYKKRTKAHKPIKRPQMTAHQETGRKDTFSVFPFWFIVEVCQTCFYFHRFQVLIKLEWVTLDVRDIHRGGRGEQDDGTLGLQLAWQACCGDPEFQPFRGNQGNWLASTGKRQLIYELFERETLYLAYKASEEKVSEFIGGCLMGDSQLTSTNLINEFADEGTVIESMWSLMKLTQMKGECPRDLGVRAKILAMLAFTQEIRDNAITQAQLVDLYVETA